MAVLPTEIEENLGVIHRFLAFRGQISLNKTK